MKYLSSATLVCNEIGIKNSEFVAKTQFLSKILKYLFPEHGYKKATKEATKNERCTKHEKIDEAGFAACSCIGVLWSMLNDSMFTVQCLVHTVHTVYSILYILYTVCTATVYTVLSILYCQYCTVYTVQYILYAVCTVYCIYCILYVQ